MVLTSCEEVLQKPLEDFKVTLVAPGNNVVTVSPVNFNWQAVAPAESYRIQIMSPAFDSAQVLVFDSVIDKNIVSLPLETGQDQWKVQAINSSSVSQESEARNLRIE